MDKKRMVNVMSFILIAILSFPFITNTALAETKTFIKEYTYRASDEDSKNSSRTIALREVKRLLLEKLGTYLESVSEVRGFNLTKDQITTLTAGIVKTELVDEKWDGHIYWLKAKIAANSDEVIKSIDVLRKDRQRAMELEEIRKRSDALLLENERLRKELRAAKDEKKEVDTAAYNKTIKELSSIEWYEKGSASYTSDNYKEAIDSFNKAIELNPQDENSYGIRGLAYSMLHNDNQAIQDYNKAIELNSKDSVNYLGRGMIYGKLGNYHQAIRDYDRAIELNLNIAEVYILRGQAYDQFKNYNKAIQDYNHAVELDPKYASAYGDRGADYLMLQNYNQAIEDCNRAIELDPEFALAYTVRGFAYAKLGNSDRAIDDLKIAAKLSQKKDLLKEKELIGR